MVAPEFHTPFIIPVIPKSCGRGEINNHHPKSHEDENRDEFHALRNGADDQGGVIMANII
jgi:hypothetical protein